MSYCAVYEINLESKRRRMIGKLSKHIEMNDWLKTHGENEHIYEIWKKVVLHSRWCWKEKNQRWGKMATPSKRQDVI